MAKEPVITRRAAARLGAGLALTALLVPAIASAAQAAEMSDAERDAAGLAANQVWWGALVVGTPAALGAVLAPEFQIVRADGTAYDKEGYLASMLPKVAAIPQFSHMAVTTHGDVLITRYWVRVDETRNDKTVVAYAPRLTVFRREGDVWLVAVHANFAPLQR